MIASTQRRVWHFEDFTFWAPLVVKMIAPEVDEPVFDSFCKMPPNA
jgi:hypothetical protein